MRRPTHVITALRRGDRREVVLLRACLDFFVDSSDPLDALVVVAAMMTSSLIAMKTTFDNMEGDRRSHNNVRSFSSSSSSRQVCTSSHGRPQEFFQRGAKPRGLAKMTYFSASLVYLVTCVYVRSRGLYSFPGVRADVHRIVHVYV